MLKHASSALSPSKTAKKPMQEKVRLVKCEICGHQSPSLHGISVHKGRIHKGLKKPDVLAEDESSDLVIVDTVENTEIEPDDAFEQPSPTIRCSLCRKTFENDYQCFDTHKYTEYWDKDHKVIFVKCPFCG